MGFLKTLNSNEYLVGLDIRGNIGYAQSSGLKKALSKFLQRNLNLNLKNKDVKLRKGWIVKEEIFYLGEDEEPDEAQ